MNQYLALGLAIAAEIAGTTSLKLSDGFSELAPSAAVVVCYLGSFYLFGLALEDLPVGLAYAIWAAVGIVGTALVGVTVFDEQLDPAAVVGMGLIVAGVVVLNVLSEGYTPAH